MTKLDLKKERKALFTAPLNEFVLIDVPRAQFVMADGEGDPGNAPAYAEAVEWLYSTVYAIKFACKAEGKDFVVPPLEGLWWADDPESFVRGRRDEWRWTMMIMVPDFVAEGHFAAAVAKAQAKRGEPPASLRLTSYLEGLSLQALHVGSYEQEAPLLSRLHNQIMPAGGLAFAGHHHEIYLSDPRKTEAAKLRTLLRQPVRRARSDV